MDHRLFYSSGSSENREIKSKDQNLSSTKEKKSKIDINKKKDNAINSLNEVEYFLNDFGRFKRYLHLYKFFK